MKQDRFKAVTIEETIMSEEKEKEVTTEKKEEQVFIDIDEEKEKAMDWEDEDYLGDYPLPRWG